MNWVWVCLAVVAGAVIPLQASANARLGSAAGNPLWGTCISVAITFTVIVGYALVARPGNPSGSGLANAPLWAYVGGLCGAVYLFSITALVPRLGGATLLGLIVLGQLFAAAIFDHFGLLNLPVHTLTPGRVLGLALLIVGVVLVRRF